MNFSIIIPTYNRPIDLQTVVRSITEQTILPSDVVIVDDGEIEQGILEKIKQSFTNKGVTLTYYKKNHKTEKRGLSESKNISLELASTDIVFILDDDVVLEPQFCEIIMADWVKYYNDRLIGIGGFIKNRRQQSFLELVYTKIFGLSSKLHWDVNSLGFQVWNNNIEQAEKGYYVHGGLASYNVTLAKKLKFKVFSGGRTANEDVDFCLRAKKMGYHFVIEPKAEAIHNQTKISREKEFLIGLKESLNRKDIFYSECNSNLMNRLKFYWANIGWILRQFLALHWQRGYGLIMGLFK